MHAFIQHSFSHYCHYLFAASSKILDYNTRFRVNTVKLKGLQVPFERFFTNSEKCWNQSIPNPLATTMLSRKNHPSRKEVLLWNSLKGGMTRMERRVHLHHVRALSVSRRLGKSLWSVKVVHQLASFFVENRSFLFILIG